MNTVGTYGWSISKMTTAKPSLENVPIFDTKNRVYFTICDIGTFYSSNNINF